MPRQKKSMRLWWLPLTIHAVMTIGVIVGGIKMVPYWHRKHMIGKLTDPSIKDRERALNYVIHRVNRDERVLAGVIEQLAAADQTPFLQTVNALDRAGQWRRPPIPDPLWLRWLQTLCDEQSPDARLNAIHFVTKLVDLAANDTVHHILRRLLTDVNDEVRYLAVLAVGQLLGNVEDPTAYKNMLVTATGDPDPTVARHAWLILGLLPSHSGVTANWRHHQVSVAEAILWAAVKTNPDQPAPAIEVLNDPQADPAVRAMAAYCLHLSRTRPADDALSSWIRPPDMFVKPSDQMIRWRAILASIDSSNGSITSKVIPMQLDQLSTQPLVLSTLYRGLLPAEALRQFETVRREYPTAWLAALEGSTVGERHFPIDPDMPEMLRLATVAVTRAPKPVDLHDLFTSDASTMRDLACVVAQDRFSDQQLSRLIESLLHDFNDLAKQSGAILAGLTGQHTILLRAKTRDEDIWSVQQIMKLGLWMQGHLPEMDRLAPGLLTRQDLPTTTILLAMLDRCHPIAWDHLFNPRGQIPSDLLELLDHYRWWRVLERYLPRIGTDPPPFWIWADASLQQFQLDVLRDWYLLHRSRLKTSVEGWGDSVQILDRPPSGGD